MGFFDRFKKNKNANKKVKRVERKRKAIDKQPDIEESQLALREIAVNSKNRHERAQATDSITNQYVALDIAKHVTDRAIRLIAANKIQDEDLLWDAAENAEFYDVRSFAYERLGENNKSIAEIVINQKKNQHVTEIFEKIEDEETLKDIAVSAVDRKFRKLALEKIDTQENMSNPFDMNGDGNVTTSEAVTFFTSLLDNSSNGENARSELFDFAKKQASNLYNKYSRTVVTDVKEFVNDIQGMIS